MSVTRTIVPDLLPHGAHIRPEYADGAWGESTDAARPAAKLDGTLRRFRKDRAASDTPQALGWIKATYPDAIEFSGSKQQTEGGIMVGAFFGGVTGWIGVWSGLYLALLPFLDGDEGIPVWVYILSISLGGLIFFGALTFIAYITLMPLRRVWRVPRDLAVIFDRKARKVYRLVLDVQPGLSGLFKPWPIKACAYDWDLLDGEHDASTHAVGKTVMRLHRLVFLVRKSADDPSIIDHFEIGNGMAQAESMVAPMWEHIRRFMEDNGPHLPHPSEPLDSRPPEKPTWWQACGQAGPFGSRYLWWWENHSFFNLLLSPDRFAVLRINYPRASSNGWASHCPARSNGPLDYPLHELGSRHRYLAAGAHQPEGRLAECGPRSHRQGYPARGRLVGAGLPAPTSLCAAATWSRYEKYLDTAAIESWRTGFEKKMLETHGTPQAKFDANWWASRKDKHYRQYFALHFDAADRNAPLARHSAGTEYASEVRRSLTPQPLASGPIQKDYVAELMQPVSSPDAVMLRALVLVTTNASIASAR